MLEQWILPLLKDVDRKYQDFRGWGDGIREMAAKKDVPLDVSVLITLDKDTKRRCAMHRLGYYYRLVKCFFLDDDFFEYLPDVTPNDAVNIRTDLFKTFLGEKRWKFLALM